MRKFLDSDLLLHNELAGMAKEEAEKYSISLSRLKLNVEL